VVEKKLGGVGEVSQPTHRQEGDARLMGGKYTESPPTFIRGKRRKNQKRCGLRTLSVKGLGVVFTHGEGISTPTRPSHGTTAFNRVCKYDFNLFYFPFTFLCLFMPFFVFFLSFCGR